MPFRHPELVLLLMSTLACGCESPPTPPETPSASDRNAATTAPAAAQAAPVASAGARTIPPLEAACTRDDECAVTDETLDGAEACCGGCTWHAGTKASLAKLRQACTATPAPMCPPIGCAMAIVEPRCVSGKCEAVPKK